MRIGTVISLFGCGILFLIGCQQQPQRESELPTQRQQPLDDQADAVGHPITEKQQYIMQGQRYIADVENAIRELEQMAVAMNIGNEFLPYRRAVDAALHTARDHLEAVRLAEGVQINPALSHLAEAINAMIDRYNQAAYFIRQHLPDPAAGPAEGLLKNYVLFNVFGECHV